MFKPGDLVIIDEDCDIGYFGGQTAIILQNVGQDTTERLHGFYYRLLFDNGTTHILTHRELTLLSKAQKKNNENR